MGVISRYIYRYKTKIKLMLNVSQLYIYPIKSLGGIAVDKASVTDRGFKYDRRWMLVDQNNIFISQREIPQMALMQLQIKDDGIYVSFPTRNLSFTIPFKPRQNEFANVSIWDDICVGQFVCDEADHWFSNMLGVTCRLVYMPDESLRITDPNYTSPGNITSFADAYPFLIIGQSSLDDLNSRLEQTLPINRFRPNIVFTGGEPFAEDLMHTLVIGGIRFYGVKLCARCPIPTIDQATAQRSKEPLKTLSRYRLKNNKVLFGQNLVHDGLGEISVGDSIDVIKLNDEEIFLIKS
ncbi:MAG: MOSC domain-containing protein [Mucilaginibacter sp.]